MKCNSEIFANFHEIYDEIPTGIAICDEQGCVRICNPSYLNILGVTKEDIIGYNIFDSYNFTQEQMDLIRKEQIYQYEVLYTVPKDIFTDSTADTLSLEVKIVRKDKEGKTSCYMIYLTNHTQKWLEYEAQRVVQEKRYRDLIDNLPLDYTHSKLIFDENGQIADYLNMSGNEQCNRFYIEHGMTWGVTLATKFLPQTGHVIIEKLNEIRNRGDIGGHFLYDVIEVGETYEMVAVFEDDEWVNLISIPITNIEQARKHAEQKLQEEQEAHILDMQESMRKIENANKEKTNFLFNVSHDIRTPLNAIMGFTDLLEKKQEDPIKRNDYIKKIHNAGNTLLDLVNNVMDMSGIEAGKSKLEETPSNIREVFYSIYSVFTLQMEQKQISFQPELDIQHEYAYIDVIKINKIFLNLLSNAYKYTNSGGQVCMKVTELPCPKDGYVTYQMLVKDNGIGIGKEFQEHLFDQFSRERNTTESGIQGSGLGMAIVKSCVDLMQGSILVDSESGKGTAFTVTLTHRIANASDLIKKQETVKQEENQFEGKRILLAEDNELNAEIATEMLKGLGFEIEVAKNGKICIDLLEKAQPYYYDLILMDVQMPVMNGYEATREIRKLEDSKKASIPIIAMTANAFEEDKKNAIEAGMNAHLSKPIDIKKVKETIQNWIG